MVLLDELNIVLRYDYLPLDEVLEVLQQAADKHVVVTGRNAKDELIEIADLVTEMDRDQASLPLRREGTGRD
jgi:cob(I)alamin adenosyltransferase